MMFDLPLIWGLLIAFAVLAYVVLDGFDLGVGILFPTFSGGPDRDVVMNSVAPVWDGNETWLVLGGGGLLAVFPLAYGLILSALYAPITAMLLGLVLRGVAFEFRWKTERNRFVWDWSFTGGSLLASFAQGVMLGSLVQGIRIADRAYAGGWFDWLTPFTVMTGSAVTTGYALLGASWLILKTDGHLQRKAYGLSWVLAVALLAFVAVVSLWTPFLNPAYLARWMSWPAILYVAPVPILTLTAAVRLLLAIHDRREVQPFVLALALFVLCYVGLGISIYPNIVPPSVTLWDAAAPDKSLRFLLIGAAVLLPIILCYTSYSYWVFRGKVDTRAGYH
jgi:cytochrome d ubiquinol oxidase subunit II